MIVEYIWLDINNDLRSKTRVLPSQKIENAIELPIWNYDGSSTGQATGENSEIILKPQVAFPDPFKRGDCLMVLCDTHYYNENNEIVPHASNTRHNAVKILKKHPGLKPMFGLEQEFFLMKDKYL